MNDINNRNPVLLIHGIIRTSSVFRKMNPYLRQRGWSIYTLDLKPNNATLGLDQMAAQVADYVNRTFAPNQPIDLVGLSMGGLVTRYYVQRLGGIDRVQRYITISSPHHGTWLAYLWNRRACLQMRPDSAFLKDLNRDSKMLGRLKFTSIWTPWDFIIVPAHSSQMPVGRNVKVPVVAHASMVINSQSLQVVASALSEPLKQIQRTYPEGHHQWQLTRDCQKLPPDGGKI
ncbi:MULTISPECIES: esterase/lipase family protein [unclassified Coleofasciculus]|uniref:esterase/lipase family protein n=1 Tax=unclassified Coleofasciculus TaxID=2692782 RepID=UPI00187F22CE|nr:MULTISPECIES: triacylglycerol lipase [unclassified Coleofasciculus]MBE9126204.1 triacylglycerol lipase [Coleofasciculus sp. LEGE 07081]MBE9149589.1 triacylglycerol lipase [Coleofasciculus sp. LEGE 07092]